MSEIYKSGDRVEMIENANGRNIGDQGTVTSVETADEEWGGQFLLINWENSLHDYSDGCYSKRLKKVEEPEPYEPQVGDIVDAHRKDWGSETPGFQWLWAQGLTVAWVDDADVGTTKPGETFPRRFSKNVLTLVSRPSAEETKSETERDYLGGVHYKSLREGDTIGFVGGEYFSVYRDKEPEPQEAEVVRPKTGTRGTALVEGDRVSGMIDEDGDFRYLRFDGGYVDSTYELWSDSLEFEPED
jgi:hypothetical protein